VPTTPLLNEMTAWLSRAGAQARARALEPRFEHVGIVEHVGDGVAEVSGLPWTRMNEILQFDSGGRAMALRVEEERVGCILLGGTGGVEAGTRVRGTGEIIRVPVGEALLSRVVDSLGAPLDEGPAIDAKRFDPIDRPAPDIVDRALVTRPLMTGLTVVDAMVPLGRGQRELIIGDRKTGKTAIAVDTMINQRESDVICVYAAIGQKASTVNQVVESVRKYGAIDRTIFVVGEASASPGAQWVTPYAACTMAEYFRDRGQDVLLILDDLTKHAMVYRTLSLLLRRPPGREAYPGDVFYIHSRLLERAANLAGEPGGSLTALPIAETQAGNLTAYIPTNLISITDGQIYLDSKLFYEGQKPAVNVGMSVSRVGGQTQAPAIRALANSLRLEYAQFLELEVFTRFGSMADERAKKEIEHGRRIRAILSQSAFHPLSLAAQSALLLALDARKLDAVALEELPRVKEKIAQRIAEDCPQSAARVQATGELSGEDRANFLAAIDAVLGIEGDTGGATAHEV
jgi:F-type H+-transporting ATPase subunit alpha